MDVFEVLLQNPTMFVIGTIFALGFVLYRRLMILFAWVTRLCSLDTRPIQHVVESVPILKEKSMDIKNTKEVLLAIDALVYDIIQSMKVDGTVQVKLAALLAKLLADKELQDKFIAAFAEYDQISPELKDFTAEEGVELASALLVCLPKYFKKSVAV